MFEFITRISKRKLANRLQDIAAQSLSNPKLQNDLYGLSDTLRNQNVHSPNWRKIDKALKENLNKLESYINDGYTNTAGNYEPWIRKLVNIRGRKEKTLMISSDERAIFEQKKLLYEKTDEINKYYAEKQEIMSRLDKLSPNNPQINVYRTELKLCGNNYIAAKKYAEQIAGNIYVIVSNQKLTEQTEFYKEFKNGQILPAEVQHLAFKLGFYQEQVAENTKQSTEYIDEIYEELNDSIIDETDELDNIAEQSEKFEQDDDAKENTDKMNRINKSRENI